MQVIQFKTTRADHINMIKYLFLFAVLFWTENVQTSNLPDLLKLDDASRQILFLDLFKRVTALESRSDLSDVIDLGQQNQFDLLKTLAESQQQWMNEIEALIRPNDTSVHPVAIKRAAFSAYLDHDIESTTNNEIIIFNKVLLNEGGYYSASSGFFTCPWSGVYDISFFLGQRGSPGNPGAWLKLFVNDKDIVMAVADASNVAQDVQGGNRVLLRLEAGDIVKVVIVGPGLHVEGNDHHATTFSAVFLFE